MNIFSPLREARLWVTVLWCLVLGVGAGGWGAFEDWFAREAGRQNLVLLPKEEVDAATRQKFKESWLAAPGILSVTWHAPADLTKRIAQRFPQPQWAELFPTDTAWLPWMAEVRFADPLGTAQTIRRFVQEREKENQWNLVIWDASTLGQLAERRSALRVALGLALGLGLLTGALALWLLPWPATGKITLYVWGIVLGAAAPAACWLAARESAYGVASGSYDDGVWLAGLAGFALASILAPVLRKRRKSTQLTIGEERDEREISHSS